VSEPNTECLSGCALDPNDFYEVIDWEDEDNWEVPKNRGDGIPDEYVHCPTVAGGCDFHDLANVVAVKIYLLARANEPTPGYTDTKEYYMGSSPQIGPFNDGFKRHVFNTTVRLNNVAARRETP
jgi:type IV pilus assembly protein PilW